jgi:hypothetical protein
MADSTPTRLDRCTAFAVLALLFGGVGALGWLLGHVLTYDATGHHHAHASHEYMRPVEQGGATIAIAGVVLAIVAVAFGRAAVARWVTHWRATGSVLPWIAAAGTPVATFVLVELAEGSIAARGLDLLAVGIPLQALIGIAVLAIVRSLLTALVSVAERIARVRASAHPRGAMRSARPTVSSRPLRFAPMATNAALRAPPGLVP